MTELDIILARVRALHDYGGPDPLSWMQPRNLEDDVFFTQKSAISKEDWEKLNDRIAELGTFYSEAERHLTQLERTILNLIPKEGEFPQTLKVQAMEILNREVPWREMQTAYINLVKVGEIYPEQSERFFQVMITNTYQPDTYIKKAFRTGNQ